MSGSHISLIVMPIVIAVALFSWLFAVLWASSHPKLKHHEPPPETEVAGGAFRAVEGGRQLMPIPEHRPAGVPGPRTAASTESYEQSAEAAGTAAAEEERPLTGTPPS